MSVADSRSPKSFVAPESALKKVEEPISLQPGVKEAEADGCSQLSPKSFFGLENVLEEIDKLIMPGTPKTKRLGIVGMGGIGKTALAMKLFSKRKESFEYSCFTADVKNIKGSLEEAILGHTHCRLGQEKLTRLRDLNGKSLLLVLDDVVSEKDLEIVSLLVGDQVHVRSNSQFIATSRDSELLKLWEQYPVSLLAPQHSRKLLETLAFPPDEYRGGVPQEYVYFDEVLRACNGLPLTLEVMGNYLYKKPNLIWQQAQQALEKGMEVVGFDRKLWAPLKLSYDRLNKLEQGVFLDAATVFYGKDLDEAKAAWTITTEGSQDMIWQHLVDLCLVKEIPPADESEFYDKRGEVPVPEELWNRRIKIGMQEQLRSLGKKIASTVGNNGRRMWETRGGEKNEAATELDLIGKDTHDVKDIISLKLNLTDLRCQDDEGKPSNEREQNFNTKLREMGNLRYLSLFSFDLTGSTSGAQSRAPLPLSLVHLHLRAAQFIKLPFTPSNYRSMAILKLENCTKLVQISRIGQLSSLRVLHISGAGDLKSLPDSIEFLTELRDLKIADCKSLIKLPESLGKLPRLERVVLENCKVLSCENIDGQSLKTLKIEACKKVPSATNFGKLAGLAILVLKDCPDLVDLPVEFGKLAALQRLVLSNCKCLQRLPDSLEKLIELKYLEITECNALQHLPKTLGKLAKLERVVLDDCKELSCENIDGHSLKTLKIGACKKVPSATNFEKLTGLEILVVKDWPDLLDLPAEFGNLRALQRLVLSNCKRLKSLPDSLGKLKELKYLEITECNAFRHLPMELGNLAKLEKVVLNKCESLQGLGELFGDLQQLKILHMEGCSSLHELPKSFLNLPVLEGITLSGTSLSTVPDLRRLKSLKTLTIAWKLGTDFPNLPQWLDKVITKENYNRQLFFSDVKKVASGGKAPFQMLLSNRRIIF